MKINELAEEFLILSKNVEKKSLKVALMDFAKSFKKIEPIEHVKYLKKIETMASQASESDLAMNILLLYNMSQVAKRDWLSFAERNKIEINQNIRDSSRDVLGKILKFLAENPNVLKQIELRVKKSKKDSSGRQELEDTINTLLKM